MSFDPFLANVPTLYVSLLMFKFEAFLLLPVINPLLVNVPILYPLTIPHSLFGFPVFAGGIKLQHWEEIC